ncbi:MAG TPA: hypothetical protein VEK07_12095 [Polyangiaceae bacterium]|nr:hypothetical protein [Polyangiaceae bacterium]
MWHAWPFPMGAHDEACPPGRNVDGTGDARPDADELRPAAPLVVREGRVLAYRLLDVADEIDLAAAQGIVRPAATRRGASTREAELSLVISAPPLQVPLDSYVVNLARSGARMEARVSARLFEYGAVSVCFDFAIAPGTELGGLVAICDELYESSALDESARVLVTPLLDRLAQAIRQRHDWEGIETYTVVFIQHLEGHPLASDILQSPTLVSLVVGEPSSRRLAIGQQQDVLEHAHSYFEDDLVVVDWNSAFVLEPSGSRDLPDILEFATSQLLELRYYDGLFDSELARVHRQFSRARHAPFPLRLRNPWVQLSNDVVRRLLELTEFTERVDNALKVIGDFYLARVYESAVRRFRIRAWQSSIDAKQALLAQAYELVRGEIDTRISTVLELVIIILILLEVALAIFFRR